MRETWRLCHHNRVPDGWDRQKATHRLRNDKKQGRKRKKKKYQSGKNEKTKIDQRERAHGVMLGGRERSITGNSSAPVFVVWGLDSVAKKKSISTTNLVVR